MQHWQKIETFDNLKADGDCCHISIALLYSIKHSMSDKAWQLGRDERDETITRVAENLFSLAYSRRKLLSDKEASDIAQQLEETAYNTAKIQSETTSGRRPDHESLKAYTRHSPSLHYRKTRKV